MLDYVAGLKVPVIVGPIYEGALSSTGTFRYDVTPLVGGVPIWLPALYLNAGVLAASAARALGRAAHTDGVS